MARQRGSLELPGNLEPQSNQPLDARELVKTKADLTNASNFPYSWVGMQVFVEAETKWYYLKAKPLTNVANWAEIGSGGGGTDDYDLLSNKPAIDGVELDKDSTAAGLNLATQDDIDALEGKFFIAEYGVTTAQEIIAFLDSAESKAPMLVKRGADYYTVITTFKQAENKAIIRTFATISGNFYIFTYTITDGTWANANYGVQKMLVSGTDIKTLNGESLLGAGDIDLPPYDDTALVDRITTAETDIGNIQTDLGNVYTKTETDAKIDEKLADYDHLDYKKADSPPTATEVVIGGQTVPVVEGTRYLVPVTGENRMEEYVVLDGEVWDLGPAAGSGVAQTETAITVSNPIGRFTMGEVIPAGTSLEEIDRKLLQKVSVPTLTDPSAALTFTAPTIAKVGTTVSGGAATVTLNRGSINPAYGTSGYRSGEATGYEIAVTGADTPYSDSNTTGAFTVPDITRATKGKVTITGTASYAAGEQPKNSDGEDYGSALAAGSKSAVKEIEFIVPFHYGATATLPRTDLSGLTEDLSKKGAKTFTVATNSEYVTFAYDAAYGDLRSIKDDSDQENIDGYTKTQITVDGFTYNVYISRFLTVDPAAVYKLSF